jgi:hypothetical protein
MEPPTGGAGTIEPAVDIPLYDDRRVPRAAE